MGFFSNLFGDRRSYSTDNDLSKELPHSPAASLTGVLQGDTSSLDAGTEKKYVTLSASTGYPIDAVYEFVLRDLEQEGYNDALVNSDLAYCKQAEQILRNKLDLLFERVTLIYREKLRNIEMKTQVANDALIQSAVVSLSAAAATLKEHMTKLSEMQQKAKNGDETFLNMIASYRRGFTKGLAASCEQIVTSSHNTYNLVKE